MTRLCHSLDTEKRAHLVQKQNHGCLDEEVVVGHIAEHVERFVHSIFLLVFVQNLGRNGVRPASQVHAHTLIKHLVVFRDGCHEDNGRDVVEAMDPFAALVTLATHVEEPVCVCAHASKPHQGGADGGHRWYKGLHEVNFVDLEVLDHDPTCPKSRTQNVLLSRHIVRCA